MHYLLISFVKSSSYSHSVLFPMIFFSSPNLLYLSHFSLRPALEFEYTSIFEATCGKFLFKHLILISTPKAENLNSFFQNNCCIILPYLFSSLFSRLWGELGLILLLFAIAKFLSKTFILSNRCGMFVGIKTHLQEFPSLIAVKLTKRTF